MKLMIASDIHGSAYWCRALMTAFEQQKPDKLLLLGDLLYHGPRNDLPREYAPKEVIPLLCGISDKILCVRGNCESEVDGMVLNFPVLCESCLLFLDGRTVFATHGHIFHENKLPPLSPGDILLHGHTHVPVCHVHSDPLPYLCLNPGSVSIPKQNSPHSYMTWQDGNLAWHDLEGGVYKTFSLDD